MRAAISRCMCENIISNSITVMPVAQPGHVIPHEKSFLQTSFIWGGGAVKQGNVSGKFHTSSEIKPETRTAIFWFVGWSPGCDADGSNSFSEQLRCTYLKKKSILRIWSDLERNPSFHFIYVKLNQCNNRAFSEMHRPNLFIRTTPPLHLRY